MGIIQCGNFSGNTTVSIGWEPQWIMLKRTDSTGDWITIDNMRGCAVGGVDAVLNPNLSNAESIASDFIDFTATGFISKNLTGSYIYTAIRRSNKPPTTGTQVYNAIARTGTGAEATVAGVGFALDALWHSARNDSGMFGKPFQLERLRGNSVLQSSFTAAEYIDTSQFPGDVFGASQQASKLGSANPVNSSSYNFISWMFRRAPGFMDVVCDTGTGAAHGITHNLTVAPELIIRKSRSAATQWEVWHSALAATEKLVLNSTAAKVTDATAWNSTAPTASQFTVGTGANVNANAATFVTYLFATLAGISKVGSYIGNGSSQPIDCGFSTGARFILIKRVDSTGDWYIWDTVRGIVAANDPHLSLNTKAAEVTTDDSIDPDASGFIVNQNAATNINVNLASYIFLAIA